MKFFVLDNKTPSKCQRPFNKTNTIGKKVSLLTCWLGLYKRLPKNTVYSFIVLDCLHKMEGNPIAEITRHFRCKVQWCLR